MRAHFSAILTLLAFTGSSTKATTNLPVLDWSHIPHPVETLDEYWTKLSEMKLIELEKLTDTANGKKVWKVTLTGEPDDDGSRMEIIINCGQHAREWSAVQTCPYLVHHWLSDKEKIKGFKIYIVPLMNPDGYEYSATTDRMWRKNRQKVDNNTEEVGIDLNRSWHYNFIPSTMGSDPTHSKQQTWAGTEAYLSIEDKKFEEFTHSKVHDKVNEGSLSDLKFHLDIHGSTKDYWILSYPPNVQGTMQEYISKHEELLKEIADAMAKEINIEHGKAEQAPPSQAQTGNTPGVLYDASGTIGDTMVMDEKIICSFLMEIPGDGNFNPYSGWPVEQLVKEAATGIDAALVEIKKKKLNTDLSICDVQRRRKLSEMYKSSFQTETI